MVKGPEEPCVVGDLKLREAPGASPPTLLGSFPAGVSRGPVGQHTPAHARGPTPTSDIIL